MSSSLTPQLSSPAYSSFQHYVSILSLRALSSETLSHFNSQSLQNFGV